MEHGEETIRMILPEAGNGPFVEGALNGVNFRIPTGVPVEVPLSLSFRSQYMQSGPVVVSPDSITVYGNADRLQGIEKITTSRIVMTELSESRHGVLRLSAPRGVRFSTDQVSYEIPVSRYVELQATLPVQVHNIPSGRQLQVYPATARVVFRCVFQLTRDPRSSVSLYVDWRDFSNSLTDLGG